MKKKLLVLLSAIAVIAVSAAVFSACSRGEGHEHALTEHKALEATCTEAGNIAYWECEECGKFFSDARGRSEIGATDALVLPIGHTVVLDKGSEPTCAAAGLTDGAHCSVCGAVVVKQNAIPKEAHTPGEWVTDREASCTEEGRRHKDCLVCGDEAETGAIQKLPHNFVGRVCTECGALETSEGLAYLLNDSGTYSVSGIGTCTDEEIIIPETYNGKMVTKIDSRAFQDCTDITSVTLPDSVKEIGISAFAGCSSLSDVKLSDSLESIGFGAFYSCRIQGIALPSSVKEIGGEAFAYCAELSDIALPDGLQTIESRLFFGCAGLQNVEIPSSVRTIVEGAFYNCVNLSDISIPNGVERIENWTFYGCKSLKNIVLPASVTGIGAHSFYGCSGLKSLEIPDKVTKIGESAFSSCSGLETVRIPASVTGIGAGAFQSCNNLKQAIFADAAGWRYSSSVGTEGTQIDESLLNDPASAAECLTSSYLDYYWTKNGTQGEGN